jgi:beta-lactamase superfamily II metal-dependent hydrolase
MSTFRLAMHAASEGDAMILTWGEKQTLHHALVDLGRTADYRALKPLLEKIGVFDLFVMTHIDADHIEGAVPLFKEATMPFHAKRVWFNAHRQLTIANERLPAAAREILGPGQAEKVTAGIMRYEWPWNGNFADGVVSTDSPKAMQPIALEGNLSIRLLSPSDAKLSKLLPEWNAELAKAHLRTTDPDEVEVALARGREQLGVLNVDFLAGQPFNLDNTKPNGASIAFIAEFAGKRVLLGADSHPDIIVASLRALDASETNRYKLDCLKVAHHGSKANTSPALLKIIDCTRFAFSTDGSRHSHPNPETIARILKGDPDRQKTLIFNFKQPSTEIWDDDALKKRWGYDCVYPKTNGAGIELEI